MMKTALATGISTLARTFSLFSIFSSADCDSLGGHEPLHEEASPTKATSDRVLQFDDQETAHQFSHTNTAIPPLDDSSIRTAVHVWITTTDRTAVLAQYGPISQWDTGAVTDMSHLFTNARFFDEDLSAWNTSSVTDMRYMFAFCSSLVGASLEHWDVSQVTDLSFAFHRATQFPGSGLDRWDVRRVTDLSFVFEGASSFSQNIDDWNVSQVRSFDRAFSNAASFSHSLCWDLHPAATAVQTFCGSGGASFLCDPRQALQSATNQHYYNCCDCEYSPELFGYPEEEGNVTDDQESNAKMGVILATVIWGMVFLMLVIVSTVMLRRRQEVRRWLSSKLNNAGVLPAEVAPDGEAIATFVGTRSTAVTDDSGSPRTLPSPNYDHGEIPLVAAGIGPPTFVAMTQVAPVWAPASMATATAVDLTTNTSARSLPSAASTSVDFLT